MLAAHIFYNFFLSHFGCGPGPKTWPVFLRPSLRGEMPVEPGKWCPCKGFTIANHCAIANPDPPILAFFRFPCFLFFRCSFLFFVHFSSFSKDFRGSAKRKPLLFFGGSFFFKTARVGGSGNLLRIVNLPSRSVLSTAAFLGKEGHPRHQGFFTPLDPLKTLDKQGKSQATQPPLTPRQGLEYRGRVPDALVGAVNRPRIGGEKNQ